MRLNSKIDSLFKEMGIVNKKIKKHLYFYIREDTVESYLEKVKLQCKEIYTEYFKKIGKVITKVVEDKKKNLTLIESTAKTLGYYPPGIYPWPKQVQNNLLKFLTGYLLL